MPLIYHIVFKGIIKKAVTNKVIMTIKKRSK